jgi:hypothetical protein
MNTRPSAIATTNTYHDNPEQYVREFRALPATEPEGLVTQVERLACAGLDLAERVSEPVTPWDLARVGVKLVAWTARKLR